MDLAGPFSAEFAYSPPACTVLSVCSGFLPQSEFAKGVGYSKLPMSVCVVVCCIISALR